MTAELAQYAAAFVAVAVASGWLTFRVLRRRKAGCAGSCGRCERALSGACEGSAAPPRDPAKADGPGIRSPELQVLRGER
ncbi:MAG: hypothetical protein R3A79_29535 [Nannocystaceae bacterium]